MNRPPDEMWYTIAFYAYLISFALYIVHVALKKEKVGQFATLAAAIGLVPHTAAFFIRWVHQGHIPLANMYEYMGLMSWMVVAGMIWFIFRYKNHRIGIIVAPVAVMMLVVASLLPNEVNRQLMPALQSTWLAIHVTMAALGSGAFLIAFAASAIYLITSERDAGPKAAEAQRKTWILFVVNWIGLPIVVALLTRMVGMLPLPVTMLPPGSNLSSGSSVTTFALETGGSSLHWGRAAIGLGMGMVVGAIVWPFVQARYVPEIKGGSIGSRFFLVLVVALLLGGIFTGFLVGSGTIRLTPQSYFKIFEFFGAVLVFSWILTPLVYRLLASSKGDWTQRIGLKRSVFEEISYAAVAIGYPLYTVGALFAGAIWAEQAWGTWWSWDPKEVGALIIWLFYTGFLHARYQRGWSGNRAAVLVVLGMVFVFISFFGNYFFGGLHSFEVT